MRVSSSAQSNRGIRGMLRLNRQKKRHSSFVEGLNPLTTIHGLYIADAVRFLKKIPDSSIQLILVDPPYNLELADWDAFDDYIGWARQWLLEIQRVLKDSGNCVIFGGFQFQDRKKGDLLEILYYLRHHTQLRLNNLVIWHYKNGMSAHRFFANRHEEAIWLSKTKRYHFDLDAVRVPYDEAAKKMALKDHRLNRDSIEKGKNPTNVWDIGRLNGNSEERDGHPTQKPCELIRRFVRALSYKGSIVLDFFAGSGTTGRVCIEEGRHSILVDSDKRMRDYFKRHLDKMAETNVERKFCVKLEENVARLIGEMEGASCGR